MDPKVVIIGAVAAGPKAACRIRRLNHKAQVTMVDRDDMISYGGCGIPFFVSGDVADLNDLRKTAFHMVRDEEFFRGAKGVEVMTRTEALSIDRGAKEVLVRDMVSGQEQRLPYDKLLLTTGTKNIIPPIPGVDLTGAMPVGNLHQAQAIKEMAAKGQVETAVIIGAGATGIEMAEALNDLWGIEVHIIEMADQVLPGLLDEDLAAMMAAHLRTQEDLHLRLGSRVESILGDDEGRVRAVLCDGEEIPTDLVLLTTGVSPECTLAKDAGLAVNPRGAVMVDEYMRTSDPDIYAGGDCVAVKHLITGEHVTIAAGSLANRQGRVAGTNICGGSDRFEGVVGSWCMKAFGLSVARTGLGVKQAEEAGLEFVCPMVVQSDRAHFHPDQKLMYLKLQAEKGTRRVLGACALGENGDAVVGRINTVAGMIAKGALVEDLSNLELAYSPPLGAAMDILNAAANTADNMLAGRLQSLTPAEFAERFAQGREDPEHSKTLFMDVRRLPDAEPYVKSLSPLWVHLPQEQLAERLEEVPKDRDVVLICNTGGRSYEAQCLLKQTGFDNTYNLCGGAAAVHKWGEPILPSEDE